MKSLFLVLWRQALPLILFPVLFVSLSFAYFVFVTPLYTSSALVRVETTGAIAPNELEAVLSSYIQTIKSDDVSAEVLRTLALDTDGKAEPSLLTQTIDNLREKYGTGSARPPTKSERETLLIDWIKSDLSVKQVDSTPILKISYTATSPEYATTVANAYADIFIAHQAKLAESRLQEKLTFARQRMQELQLAIQDAQVTAQNIKTSEGETLGRFENLDNRINQLTLQLSDIDQIESGLAEQIAILKERDELKSLEAAAANIEGGRQLLQTYYDLTQSLSRQEANGASQTTVGQLAIAAEDIRSELVRIRDQELNELEQEQQITAARRESLERKLEDVNVLINSGEWAQIQSAVFDATAFRGIYAEYLKEIETARKTASVAMVSKMTQARANPNPSWPNYKLLLVLAAFAGLGVGAVIAFLREMNRSKLQTQPIVAPIVKHGQKVSLQEIWSELEPTGTEPSGTEPK